MASGLLGWRSSGETLDACAKIRKSLKTRALSWIFVSWSNDFAIFVKLKIYPQHKTIMDYTKEQKMAMSKVLLDIVSVDEHIDARETLYFERVKNTLDLTTQDHFDVLHMNTLRCLSIIKTMSVEQKSNFAQMMREMILADRFIDPSEATSFYDICEFVNINGVGLSMD